MGRKILAVVIGVIVGFIVVFIGDATTHKLSSGPDNANQMDKEAMSAYIAGIPVYVLVIMVLFWALAAFLGGFISGKINSPFWKQCALITGGILLAATLLNLAMITHPVWMWIAALALIMPAAYLGGKAAAPKVIVTP
jgi:hypothetical protein